MKLRKQQKLTERDIKKTMVKYFWTVREYKDHAFNSVLRYEHRVYDIQEMVEMHHHPDFFNRMLQKNIIQAEILNDRKNGR